MQHRNHVSDLRGVSRLAIDATTGVTSVVEAMHRNISRPTALAGGLVYKSIRGIARLVGGGIDVVLAPLAPLLGNLPSSREREALVAALNGVLGDHLAASKNPLAIPMRLRRDGRPFDPSAETGGRIVVFVHGLCMGDRQWGHASLASELGYAPVYLSYNTGLHISSNGRAFAALLDDLVRRWPTPVEELVIVGHSMGGLVARSACHHGSAAGHVWLRPLRKIVFLGTPHHGAPLERRGNLVDAGLGALPYAAPLAGLGRIRSAGITDLRHGSLLDEDWRGRDRFAYGAHRPRPVPLPAGVECYAVAAAADRLVPVASALGRHRDPARALALPDERRWVASGLSHLDLLDRAEVYAQLGAWLRR